MNSDLYCSNWFNRSEPLSHTPDSDEAVSAPGDHHVGVVEGGEGAHPVRFSIDRVGSVTTLNLEYTNRSRGLEYQYFWSFFGIKKS